VPGACGPVVRHRPVGVSGGYASVHVRF
jgi:hypothetical protein